MPPIKSHTDQAAALRTQRCQNREMTEHRRCRHLAVERLNQAGDSDHW
jgi:hypothetical protein